MLPWVGEEPLVRAADQIEELAQTPRLGGSGVAGLLLPLLVALLAAWVLVGPSERPARRLERLIRAWRQR